jgi:hypothetical protein
MTNKQELSIKLNKLLDNFQKQNKCNLKDINFTITL